MTQQLAPLVVKALKDDPELAAIAACLRATASYAVNPFFIEKLRRECLRQFRQNFAKEGQL